MNTFENCVAGCPIVKGLPDELKETLLLEHRRECLSRRIGQLGALCGIPDAADQNQLTKAVVAIPNRNEPLVTV